MTTTTVRSNRLRRRARRGMTILELTISLSIAATVMSSVFGSFIFLARSSLISTAYSGMDAEARTGLEIFGRDVRMAREIQNPGNVLLENSITLLIPTSTTTTKLVTYTYDPETKVFYRNRGQSDERELIRGVEVFVLKHFSIREDASTGLPDEAVNVAETKQVQIQLRAERTGAARAKATNNVISARYILRNKFVGS